MHALAVRGLLDVEQTCKRRSRSPERAGGNHQQPCGLLRAYLRQHSNSCVLVRARCMPGAGSVLQFNSEDSLRRTAGARCSTENPSDCAPHALGFLALGRESCSRHLGFGVPPRFV